jgi:predicted transcriptional regulator
LGKETLETRKLRDRFCLIAEILVVAKDGSLKPQIMYKADLSLSQLNEYLSRARSLAQKKYDMLACIDREEDY